MSQAIKKNKCRLESKYLDQLMNIFFFGLELKKDDANTKENRFGNRPRKSV